MKRGPLAELRARLGPLAELRARLGPLERPGLRARLWKGLGRRRKARRRLGLELRRLAKAAGGLCPL